MKLTKSPIAGGNVIKLSERWYLSPVEVKKMIDVFSYLSFRFIGVTFKMILKKLVVTKMLNKGDIILLIDDGLGFKMMEDAVIMEIKQGPYVGIEDKEQFA